MRFLSQLSLLLFVFVIIGSSTAQSQAPRFSQGTWVNDSKRVIVGLNTVWDTQDEYRSAQMIAGSQARLVSALGSHATDVYQYSDVPYVAMTVTEAGYQQLQNSPLVSFVQENRLRAATLDVSTGQIGADVAWAQGLTGTNNVVAILDSGVDKNHEFLQGQVVEEACYATSGVFEDPDFGLYTATSPCPGANSVGDSTGPGTGMPCLAEGCDHGTHVAGIAAGKSTTVNGVAPGAKIMAVQVFTIISNEDICYWYAGLSSPCALAFDEDIIAGLNRVYARRNKLPIVAANMSLGGGYYMDQAQCNSELPAYLNIATALKAANIAVIAASGNGGFYEKGVGAPGCVSNIISVGSVDSFNQISFFSQYGPMLTLLAPGEDIYSSTLGNLYDSWDGTSMAAPHVAGAWAIMREKVPTASVDNILKAFRKTGLAVNDVRLNRNFKIINIGEALEYYVKPGQATLIAPAHKAHINSVPNTFSWTPTADTTDYRLIFIRPNTGAVYASYDIPTSVCGVDSCSVVLPTAFPHGKKLKWYVQSRNEYRKTNSVMQTFNVSYPGPATLTDPIPDAVGVSLLPTFTWQPVETATDYKLVVVNVATRQKVLTQIVTGTTFTLTTPLKAGRTYKWFVIARNELGSTRSAKFKFTTGS